MFRGARSWTASLPCLFLTILIVTLAVPRQGFTQVLYGSILGDIKDSSGALVPGATVVVTNKSTGLSRELVSDQSGRFTKRWS